MELEIRWIFKLWLVGLLNFGVLNFEKNWKEIFGVSRLFLEQEHAVDRYCMDLSEYPFFGYHKNTLF